MSDEIARAGRARQILEDPMIVEAFSSVEKTMTDAWKDSPDTDTEGRERCFRALLGLRAFQAFFEIAISNGQVAEHQAKQYRESGKTPQL